jgi:hypothetical protein
MQHAVFEWKASMQRQLKTGTPHNTRRSLSNPLTIHVPWVPPRASRSELLNHVSALLSPAASPRAAGTDMVEKNRQRSASAHRHTQHSNPLAASTISSSICQTRATRKRVGI